MIGSFKKKAIFFIVLSLALQPFATQADNVANDPVASDREQLFEGFIYYADPEYLALKSVPRRFPAALDAHQLAMEILHALITGPGQTAVMPTWPADVTINAFFIADDKKAYVDLNLDDKKVAYMDTQQELLAIYSLVNSLIVNIPDIKMVKILINGKDRRTLAGHIDLEYFYKTNMLIVK